MERRQRGRGTLQAASFACVVVLLVGWALAGAGAVRAGAEGEAVSYEAGAAAEGVRFSWSAPGFAVVDTFVDGGGPVAQTIIDGLGNSRGFASSPYPGDLAISGPGLLAGLTGLPSPPPYPFYVDSSYPTKEEAKFAQPGYELLAKSTEQSSESTATTGGVSGESGVGVTKVRAFSSRDPATGAVSAEASGTADIINIGGVLRIANASAMAKVTRAPGAEPTRESAFSIGAVTISGQTVGISDKGFTLGPNNTPIPPDNPLAAALEQAKISVRYLYAQDNPDGVVSPGLVITHEAQIPGGPLMVFRYVFGQMTAHATVSGSPTSIGTGLPLETGPPSDAGDSAADGVSEAPVAADFGAGAPGQGGLHTGIPPSGSTGSLAGSGAYGAGAGAPATAEARLEGASPTAPVAEGASPLAGGQRASGPSAESVYLIIVLGALAALGGGLVIRILGVKLAWTS